MTSADRCESLFEIGKKVGNILDAGGVTHQPFRNPNGGALLGRALDVTRDQRRPHHRLDAAEIGGTMHVAQPRQENLYCLETTADAEAQHAAEATHLALCDVVMRVGL